MRTWQAATWVGEPRAGSSTGSSTSHTPGRATSVTAGATGGATTPIYSATAHVDATVSYGFDTTTKSSKEM